jgi:phage terminase Nu1 subunit (DNA packaging protein)
MATKRKTAATYDAWLNEDDDDGRATQAAAIDSEFEGPGETVDKKTLARIMGMTAYAIDEAVARGAPVFRRGSQRTPWQFQAGAFLCWLIKDRCGLLDDADATQAAETHRHKTRLMAAQADRVERINEAARAETLTLDEVVTLYADEAAVIREHLNAIPGRAVEALAALPADERRNARIVEDVLDDCVNSALRAISGGVEHASA